MNAYQSRYELARERFIESGRGNTTAFQDMVEPIIRRFATPRPELPHLGVVVGDENRDTCMRMIENA